MGGGSRIRVRGVGSLSLAQEPLVYVDGVRGEQRAATGPINQGFGTNTISRFNDINPEDIESIEVIRGPAAATLYGTEASNGVIQIITKRGSAGGTRWDMSVRQGAIWFGNAEGRVWTNYGRTVTGDTIAIDMVELEREAGRRVWQTGRAAVVQPVAERRVARGPLLPGRRHGPRRGDRGQQHAAPLERAGER